MGRTVCKAASVAVVDDPLRPSARTAGRGRVGRRGPRRGRRAAGQPRVAAPVGRRVRRVLGARRLGRGGAGRVDGASSATSAPERPATTRWCRARCAPRRAIGPLADTWSRAPRVRRWPGCTRWRRRTSSRAGGAGPAERRRRPPRHAGRGAGGDLGARRSSSPRSSTARSPPWTRSPRSRRWSALAGVRLTLVARGLDPKSLVVVEAGHLELRAEYRAALAGYRTGEPDGRRASGCGISARRDRGGRRRGERDLPGVVPRLS